MPPPPPASRQVTCSTDSSSPGPLPAQGTDVRARTQTGMSQGSETLLCHFLATSLQFVGKTRRTTLRLPLHAAPRSQPAVRFPRHSGLDLGLA